MYLRLIDSIGFSGQRKTKQIKVTKDAWISE